MASARRPARALLETLRAPLLLSPVADVLAGATLAVTVAIGDSGPYPASTFLESQSSLAGRLPTVGLAMLAGCLLLAAGMAYNAYADREDDRRRKPERPLPRGDISPAAVRNTWILCSLAGLFVAALISEDARDVGLGIVVLTWLYHVALKRWRLPGCLALGTLRGAVVLLGLLSIHAQGTPGEGWAAWRSAADPSLLFDLTSPAVLFLPVLYGLYIGGASLHASTDDEPVGERAVVWSRVGLGLSSCVLLLLVAACLGGAPWSPPQAAGGSLATSGSLGAAVFAYATWRLHRAAARKPPPAVTGVALSGLYLFHAGATLHFGRSLLGAVLILALFGVSRLLLRTFPPS